MGFKYRITSDDELYFLTMTVVDWIDVFTRKELCLDLLLSLNYCQQHKGLKIYSWCLMPSHLHLVVSVEPGPNTLSDVMRDFKKFTSKKIVSSIKEIAESRREWLLRHFAYAGKFNPKIKEYQFWQEGLHPIELKTFKFIEQKINYIHNNPVEAGMVYRAEDYVWSSAAQYAGEYNPLLTVLVIEDVGTMLRGL
ncbi:REP-associated tyrosine transposase [Mucilaginibacter myungsuensis]|uniref:Transposase n=1 Tax=Mucilaginibacter myungsuensis TaxID=649104 RepID=A0A929PVX7_9SPHI|nr:transposase [Mucilaginibacter myungsuensis]MBE9660562.1 transposase [Mucilaginibacter myungsuensis]MDN3600607.1 transposase [Mucilaginibacter myungsuensis]